MIKEIAVFILVFSVYIIYTGSFTAYDMFTGILISIFISMYSARFLVSNERKLMDPRRAFTLIYYLVKYMVIIELRAHIDVIKRIFTMDIKPGIVKIPMRSTTEYGKLLVAMSITNTPGTVVVYEKNGYFYVNWIYVKTFEPERAYTEISSEFEKYAIKVFE